LTFWVRYKVVNLERDRAQVVPEEQILSLLDIAAGVNANPTILNPEP